MLHRLPALAVLIPLVFSAAAPGQIGSEKNPVSFSLFPSLWFAEMKKGELEILDSVGTGPILGQEVDLIDDLGVREGPNTRRRLSDLDLAAVLDLYRNALAMDQNSAQVLESYLDRMRSEDWREKAGGSGEDASAHAGNGASGGAMSVAEARAILGIDANASSDEIKQAHRRLMGQYHPDRGGSDYLAARINQAKDILLGK